MNTKQKKIISGFFIFAAVLFFAVFVYGIILTASFFNPQPTIQMLQNPTSEQKNRIAEIAGLDAEHKILYIEKWKNREPVLIIWITDQGETEKNRLHINSFKKTEMVRKYDPLSQTFVTGDYYENDSPITVYAYKNYSGEFTKYQISFDSPGALNSISDIFQGVKQYKAGALIDYDEWRLHLDRKIKGAS